MTQENDKSLAARLFRESVGTVRQIKTDKIRPEKPRSKAVARQKRLDDETVMRELLFDESYTTELQPGDILNYCQPGVQPKTMKKLRNGNFRVDAECDLHGLTAVEAKQILIQLLADAEEYRWRCLKIIHGKGMRSSSRGPVLKGLVNHFLRCRETILAFHSAKPDDGGTGAAYVLLKSH